MDSCSTKINLSDVTFKSCGDLEVNMNELLTSNISNIRTVKEFSNVLHSEFIDVKNRKVISSYPTLKALYNRYKTSFQDNPQSSAYNYLNMNRFVKLVGDYWIDLIEQVIPSTTLWGSTNKHRNTIFDGQKYRYKKYSLKTCGDVSNIIYPSPTSGRTTNVGVEVRDITLPQYVGPDCLAPTGETTTCNSVYLEQINYGSEFIGSVNIIGNVSQNSTGDRLVITECDLIINNIIDNLDNNNGILTFTPSYIGGTSPYIYQWEIISTEGEFSNWDILNNSQNNEVFELTGDTIINDSKICVSLTITDKNNCEYSLTNCLDFTSDI